MRSSKRFNEGTLVSVSIDLLTGCKHSIALATVVVYISSINS